MVNERLQEVVDLHLKNRFSLEATANTVKFVNINGDIQLPQNDRAKKIQSSFD